MKNKTVNKPDIKNGYYTFRVFCSDGDKSVTFIVHCDTPDFDLAEKAGQKEVDDMCEREGRDSTFVVVGLLLVGLFFE